MRKKGVGIFVLLLLITGCGATVTPPPPVFVRAAGATSTEPLLAILAEAYSAEHPHVSFDIRGGGSQLGQQLAQSDRVDLGMVSWTQAEASTGLRTVPLGRDAIAVILNPANPLAGLSIVDLRDIFSGRLLNWQALGGIAAPIQVVSREDGSGSRAAFESLVMENEPVTPNAIVLPNSQAVVDFVEQTPNAIAYVSLAFTGQNQVFTVPIEGIPPTLDTIQNGSYPLTRPLAVVVSAAAHPEVDRFLAFARSPAGQQLVAQWWGRVGQ